MGLAAMSGHPLLPMDGLHLCLLLIKWVAEFIIEREVTSIGNGCGEG